MDASKDPKARILCSTLDPGVGRDEFMVLSACSSLNRKDDGLGNVETRNAFLEAIAFETTRSDHLFSETAVEDFTRKL